MDENKPERVVGKEGETPLLVLAGGWPRDLLSWVFAIPPLLYLGAVAAGFAGFSVFVLLLLVTSDPVVSAFLGIPVAGFTWFWWAREHFGVTHERVEFYNDGVLAFLKVVHDGTTHVVRHELRYEDIGSVVLDPKRATIRFRFGMPHPETRSNFLVSLPRLSVRDQYDQILEWFEAAAPNHLFLQESDDVREYSREFTLEEIYPEAQAVSGEVVLPETRNNMQFELSGRKFELVHDGFGKVRVLREGTGHVLSGISVITTTTPSVRILGDHGLEIARCILALKDGHAVIELGFGEPIHWRVESGELMTIDASDARELIGTTGKQGEDLLVRITRPIPEPTALALLLVISFLPQMSFIQSAVPQPA